MQSDTGFKPNTKLSPAKTELNLPHLLSVTTEYPFGQAEFVIFGSICTCGLATSNQFVEGSKELTQAFYRLLATAHNSNSQVPTTAQRQLYEMSHGSERLKNWLDIWVAFTIDLDIS